MKKHLSAALTATAALLGSTQAHAFVPPQYVLTYDAATGIVSIETGGDVLYNYVIQGSTPGDPNDGFIELNAIPLPGAPTPTATDDEISASWTADFTGWTLPSPTSLGQVLPIGWTELQFNDFLTRATYADQFGSQTFYDFDIQYVPEPTSLLLLAGGLAMLTQRRKR